MKNKEFLRELKALLEKYNGSIGFEVDSSSDTHGITGEKMTISMREVLQGNRYPSDITILEVNGWNIDSKDIKP